MDGVAELGRRKLVALAVRATAVPASRRQAEHTLCEVAIRAALEESKRAVRQSSNVVHRRSGSVQQGGQLDAETRSTGRQLIEERQLKLEVVGAVRLGDRRGLRSVSTDGEDEARLAAFELDRRVLGLDDRLVSIEPFEDPADGRRAIGGALGIDRAGDDQAIDRPRHRDVVEPEPLRTLLVALPHRCTFPNPKTGCRSPRRRMHHPEPEPAVRERDDLVRPARATDVTPRVRHDHDLELETLCAVDRQEPDRATALLLGHCLELLRAERVLLADELDEPGDVGAADRLVVTCEATELAEVREATRAVPAREDGEVVVVLGDDLLA